jgi:ribosome-associated heat shock protein Hsp15
MDSARLDRWLWSVRLAKTRSDAAGACRGGHVRVNDRPAKPATTVHPGDRVRARVYEETRIVEIVKVIDKRVGAPDAQACYVDHTPPPLPRSVFAVRDRGTGRPTKRERRALEQLGALRPEP